MMELLAWYLAILAGQIALAFSVQIAVFRWLPPAYPALAMLRLSILTLVLGAIAASAVANACGLAWDVGVLAALGATGGAGAVLVAFCVLGPTMVDRSVSVFMLIRIMNGGLETGVGRKELYDRLDFPEIYDKRVREHEHVGALAVRDDRLLITPKGARMAKLFLVMARLYKLNGNF